MRLLGYASSPRRDSLADEQAGGWPAPGSCRPLMNQKGDEQQGDDIEDLDHRVDRGAGRIFVGIADGVARDRSFMRFGALAAEVSVLDVLLGVVPRAAAAGHRNCEIEAGDDGTDEYAAHD